MRFGRVVPALLLSAETLAAQTITSGSVQGSVTAVSGDVVEEATVLATNLATGERWRVQTRSGGRYVLEHLTVGGPYRLEVRALGSPLRDRETLYEIPPSRSE
jgi:Carboxypeptidase regulatory-like domain